MGEAKRKKEFPERRSAEPLRTHPVTGLQLRAARTLAGMTQRDLAAALGVNERAVRFWERKRDRKPVGGPNDERIEKLLLERGVILFTDPTPGVRLAQKR